MLHLQIAVCILHLTGTSQFGGITFQVAAATDGKWLLYCIAQVQIICVSGRTVFQLHRDGLLGCFQLTIAVNYYIFQTIRCTSSPKFGRKWRCVLQSECSLPGLMGGGVAVEWVFFFLFSSSKTQVCLMVQCVLQSEKYGTWQRSYDQLPLRVTRDPQIVA